MNSVVTRVRADRVEQVAGLGDRRHRGAEAHREQHLPAEPERERERRRAGEDVARPRREDVARERVAASPAGRDGKCTHPFGVPVVPDVKAMIATSSAAVSTGSNDPRAGRSSRAMTRVRARRPRARRRAPARAAPARAVRAPPWARLRDDLRDLPRAQQRHRRHDDPARQQDAEPGGDRLGRVGRVQQHALARLDRERAPPPPPPARPARRSSSPPAIAVPSWRSSSTAAFRRSGPSSRAGRATATAAAGGRGRTCPSVAPRLHELLRPSLRGS